MKKVRLPRKLKIKINSNWHGLYTLANIADSKKDCACLKWLFSKLK